MNQPRKIERQSSPLADPASAVAAVTPRRPGRPPGRRPALAAIAEAPPDVSAEASPVAPPRRPERRRWGDRRFNLPKHNRPGFVAHIFNDVPGNIERAKERGYTHVMKDGSPVQLVVDRTSGTIGFLMEIPKEFYDEDFADKQAVNDATDMAIASKAMSDGGYRPMVPGTNQPVTKTSVIRGREPA